MPGWPLLAFSTASIDSVRIVSMLRRSMSTLLADSVVVIPGGYPRVSFVTVPPMALPDFPWTSQFRDWEGLRLAHLAEASAPPFSSFHGEPTWSFLWRKVMPPVLDAGFRCIAPDLPGFGRSDKPTDIGWYSYDRHVDAARALVEELDLTGATAVVHDWGGPIGLRVATELAERLDRLVILDTGLFTGRQHMTDAWIAFRDFVERSEALPIGFLVRGACKNDPGEDVIAAYDAPYP